MKKIYRVILTLIIATVITGQIFAQDQKRERITASYVITFGRQPTNDEMNYWMGQQVNSLEQLVKNHSSWLNGNRDEKRKLIIRAFQHAYGYAPSESDINKSMSENKNYTEWMTNHINYLRGNSTAWNNLVGKVYSNVCRRSATDNDKRSWPQSEAKPYWMVAAVVDKWQAENRHNSTKAVRSGNSYGTFANLSNPVASEASRIIGSAAGNVIAPGGGNVIAPGGANAVASGGGNVIAAGGGN
jgi:hypothetical protein